MPSLTVVAHAAWSVGAHGDSVTLAQAGAFASANVGSGIAVTASDALSGAGAGNYTLGLKEQIVFPEIQFDKVDAVRGMNVTFVTTAKTNEEGRELLKRLGMPFRS